MPTSLSPPQALVDPSPSDDVVAAIKNNGDLRSLHGPCFPVLFQGFVAYLEFLQDVDIPVEAETQAYIDNFVFGRDQVREPPLLPSSVG